MMTITCHHFDKCFQSGNTQSSFQPIALVNQSVLNNLYSHCSYPGIGRVVPAAERASLSARC